MGWVGACAGTIQSDSAYQHEVTHHYGRQSANGIEPKSERLKLAPSKPHVISEMGAKGDIRKLQDVPI